MNKQQSDTQRNNYKNKSVLNQRGGNIQFNNSTGTEGIYITNYVVVILN